MTEGETLRVQIEDVGDQGDGLARVGPGYVVFVPDTEVGQQPLVRVTTVRENVAFAEVVEQ
ncbi:TRAM domain-containing protein [Salinigranum salinum]|uniref:TRAM domain-containing protein n=1 Tax=Salinigranum salinum TaxID=1364937 RepID=UPI001865151D|nr:TRAM domain-containing protein [Salinigranum salinum]